jgi:SOS-response transcriptional repressor LexA
MANDITPFSKVVLQVIVKYREQRGYSPSLREIAREMGYKNVETMVSSVRAAIEKLEEQGYLTVTPSIARSYVPTKKEIT